MPPASLPTEWVMRLVVRCEPPWQVGRIATGERAIYPISGGQFAGPRIAGQVLPGADVFLRRPDGVGLLDARYALQGDDGGLIVVHNTGLLVPQPGAGDEAFSCHCQPRFEVAADSPHAWLVRECFVGRVDYPTDGTVRIDVYRVA